MRRTPLLPLQNLFRQLHTVVPREEATADPAASAEPLLIFDPHAPDTPERLRGMCPIRVDGFLAAQLRSHQREGVRFMVHCLAGLRQEGHSGCILCDGMGLGKTFQVGRGGRGGRARVAVPMRARREPGAQAVGGPV